MLGAPNSPMEIFNAILDCRKALENTTFLSVTRDGFYDDEAHAHEWSVELTLPHYALVKIPSASVFKEIVPILQRIVKHESPFKDEWTFFFGVSGYGFFFKDAEDLAMFKVLQ
jgi:hypothetical protein